MSSPSRQPANILHPAFWLVAGEDSQSFRLAAIVAVSVISAPLLMLELRPHDVGCQHEQMLYVSRFLLMMFEQIAHDRNGR